MTGRLAPTRGRFVIVLGIDGSGKSSLLRGLAASGVHTASWQQLRDHELPAALAPAAPTDTKNRLTPLARAMFIGGHLVAQYEYLVRPRIEAGTTVVLDSYYVKLLAKERILGVAHPAFVQLCAQLPQPDAVILLEVNPQESLRRKQGRLSTYEYFHPDEDSFLDFQTRLAAQLKQAAEQAVDAVILDGARSRDAVLQDALRALTTMTAGQGVAS